MIHVVSVVVPVVVSVVDTGWYVLVPIVGSGCSLVLVVVPGSLRGLNHLQGSAPLAPHWNPYPRNPKRLLFLDFVRFDLCGL